MNTLAIFTGLLLVGLASTAPVDDEILHIKDELFNEYFEIYTGENDITNIVVPVNNLNFEDTPDDEMAFSTGTSDIYIFFVEADKGLFVLKNKTATKLLDNGKDISAPTEESKKVYFAATDGLYTFNSEKNTAEKYGTLTDNIINLAVANGTNEIYILTNEHVVYKVTEEGTKKEEVTSVKDAQQIVFDSENNLYFIDKQKQVYVLLRKDGTVNKIKGLPASPSSVHIVRPPLVLEESVPVVAGKKIYLAFANGTAEFAELVVDTKVTAAALEPTLLVYAAHNKKIYEYNLLNIIVVGLIQEELRGHFDEVQSFFNEQKSEIRSMATRPVKSIRA